MSSRETRKSSGKAKPEVALPPMKRFRIEKLEERVAPKKGGNGTNNCGSSGSVSTETGSIVSNF